LKRKRADLSASAVGGHLREEGVKVKQKRHFADG
jgi:hypothetical protein